MDFSLSDLNFNSVETLQGFEVRAAFSVNSAPVFKEDVDIVPTIVDLRLRRVSAYSQRRRLTHRPPVEKRSLLLSLYPG